MTDVVTGYYDSGIVGGKNKLVPSVSFQVKNTAAATVRSVQLNAVFRVIGDQQGLGSAFVRGIDASGLAPGASTPAYVLRSSLGYTGEQPRSEMLQHKEFHDVQVQVFAKQAGAVGEAGEWTRSNASCSPADACARPCASRARPAPRPADAAAIIVSNVIGGGILFTPPLVAASVPSPVWFLGDVAGRRRCSRSRARWPTPSSRRCARGPAASTCTCRRVRSPRGLPDRLDVVCRWLLRRHRGQRGGARVLRRPLRARGHRHDGRCCHSASVGAVDVSRQSLVALAAIALMAWIHLRGVGPGRFVSNVLAALKVSALLLFIALGFSFGAGSASHLSAAARHVAAGTWLLALIPVMFTYSGWNAAAYVAEEIHEPGRNVPRALALGTLAVVAIYLLLNLLYLYVLPVDELAQVRGSVLDVVADRLLGARAGDIMGVVSIISIAASISAMTFAGPRVYYAMARDGLFFPAAARVHRGYRTPAASIVAQARGARCSCSPAGAERADTLHGVCRRALFGHRGRLAVRAAAARARAPSPSYSAWGYPGSARHLRAREPRDRAQRALLGPRPVPWQEWRSFCLGLPLFFFFKHRGIVRQPAELAAGATTPERHQRQRPIAQREVAENWKANRASASPARTRQPPRPSAGDP